MEEDDDFYGGGGEEAQPEPTIQQTSIDDEIREQRTNASENGDEEEEDSEDDIKIVLEKPEAAKAETLTSARPSSVRPPPSQDRAASTDPRPAKAAKHSPRPSSTAPPQATTTKSALTHNGKEGAAFPEIRTSKLDLDASPSFPLPNGVNKPITEIDLDADLAEHIKPWRLPGTDQTDFFNYGFDEYTWTQYCIRQQSMAGTIGELKASDAQMKAMFGAGGDGAAGGGMPSMPGMGGGGGMPAMPDPGQMMQQMMQSGMEPGKMDFGQFMAMMGGPGGMPGMGGGGVPQGQQGNGFASPNPQHGQGFQPPSGPGGGQGGGQGQQGGFGGAVNMEGFSPQQIAIMQQEQMGAGQGGGGRGRGRRGRGFY